MSASSTWYNIILKAHESNGAFISSTSVSKVGIGEIFIVAGQSNAASCGELGNPLTQNPKDTVSTIDNFSTGQWRLAVSPINNLYPLFPGNPVGTSSDHFSILGSQLTQILGVPVGIISIGVPAASLQTWTVNTPPNNTNFGDMFMVPLVTRLQGQGGFRGVLWQQGEADAVMGTDANTYITLLSGLIAKSRVAAQNPILAWFVATTSYVFNSAFFNSANCQPYNPAFYGIPIPGSGNVITAQAQVRTRFTSVS